MEGIDCPVNQLQDMMKAAAGFVPIDWKKIKLEGLPKLENNENKNIQLLKLIQNIEKNISDLKEIILCR